jgi:hypothetical protein
MDRPVVTIIGMGPRGLTFLDRIVEAFEVCKGPRSLDIHLIDPGEMGQGVHPDRQPQHLLINTIGVQVTMYPNRSIRGGPPRSPELSLVGWARMIGYRRFATGYYVTDGSGGEEISEHDYLPRRLLGEYLTWIYDRIAANLPAGIRLFQHRGRAVDIRPGKSGDHSVELENGFSVTSNFIFLATGHCNNTPSEEEVAFEKFASSHARKNGKLLFVRAPYPVDKLVQISPSATVAIQGLGLTAHDVISELTAGRGGRFVPDGDKLRYQKSGREPRILLFSRNCLPSASRGVNQKGIAGQYKPLFLTVDAVHNLRQAAIALRGSPQLDFDREIFPLLLKEMTYVYRCTKGGVWTSPDKFEPDETDCAAIGSAMYPLRGMTFDSLEAYRRVFTNYVIEDLREAERGNVDSPIKAATDVLRDVRSVLRLATEYSGLTPESHRKLIQQHVPMMNRIAFGPPKRRNIELLALLEADVVSLASGPNPKVEMDWQRSKFVIESSFDLGSSVQYADVLIAARLDVFYPEKDLSPLFGNLLRGGLVRPHYNGWYHPGGIDIDERNHPIDRNGNSIGNMWAVGYVVEGPHFYTHALPRPLMGSRHFADADLCVLDMFDAIFRAASMNWKSSKNSKDRNQLSPPTPLAEKPIVVARAEDRNCAINQ